MPKSKPDPTRGVTNTEIVHCITVDSRSHVWFGTNGGAYLYDGTTLTHDSQQHGLPGDVVHRIVKASNGDRPHVVGRGWRPLPVSRREVYSSHRMRPVAIVVRGAEGRRRITIEALTSPGSAVQLRRATGPELPATVS